MSHLDNDINNFFIEDMKAEMEKMRRQNVKFENLLRRIEKENQKMLLDIKTN